MMTTLNFSATKCTELPAKGIFRIVKCIGEGKTYLLKCLKPAYAERRAYRTLLKREFEAVRRIDSPWLPTYHALLDESPYGPCIVEEYIDARPLSEYVSERHSPAESEAVLRQIIDALRSIHARYMQHRDLKPSNVLVTRQGNNVRLIDLRPAYADEIQAPRTSQRYLAPEQKDETVAVDARADIYALGLLMHDMRLADRYGRVACKCGSMGRSDRYADVDELVGALDGKGMGGPRRSLRWVAVLALGVLLALGGWWWTSGGPAESGSPSVEAPVGMPSEMQEDSSATVPSAQAAGLNTDSVRRVLEARLDVIYAAAQTTDTVPSDARKAVRRQVKAYYKQLIQSLGKMTQAERDVVDQAFGDYVKRKNAQ